jgi:GTPase SAR1 family protein
MEKNIEQPLEKAFAEKIQITENPPTKKTLNLIVLGMAGSGKTTFVQKLEEIIAEKDKESYIINLDPAVMDTLYEANMDIRDTINYKNIMLSNNLGPNGAILTCLNIFSTNIDKILDILNEKENLDYIINDTPGQLEVFSWSASGKLISDSFSVIYPSVLIYIVDIPRCSNPNTFTSNMLYAISIMYKMRLPMVLAFNKKDVEKEDKCFKWIKNYEELQNSLQGNDEYISSFSQSLTLVLEEFYNTIKYVAVSSKTGDGFEELLEKCDEIVKNYMEEKEENS